MKVGDKVDFYVLAARGKAKQMTGTLIAFNDVVCEIIPNGKTKAVSVPRNQVMDN